jgi:flagellar L-ring protein FlgH
MPSIGKRAGVYVLLLALSPGVRAQSVPNSDSQTPADNTSASADNSSGSGQDTSVPIGILTERAGGSLARATLDSRTTETPAGTTPTGAASYFSVPDPPPKLLKKHDLVTVVVNEQSAYTTTGDNKLQKAADFDNQIADYVHMTSTGSLVPEQPSNPLEFNATASRDLSGQAQVDRTDSVTARITAEVVDVKPNGTLVLRASETIKTDDEIQDMSLTGTCRVEDITADNSILSTQLFDLHLTKNHQGQVRDTTKRGLIPRLLDWIDPF